MSTMATTKTIIAPRTPRRLRYLYAALGLVLLWLILRLAPVDTGTFPEAWNIGLDDAMGRMQSWVIGARNTNPIFLYVIDPIRSAIDRVLRTVEGLLVAAPWPAVLIALYAVANKAAGRKVALFATGGLFLMGVFDLWVQSMQTLALMGVSVAIALLIGIPLGILTARSMTLHRVLRPVLDAMQTMPAFVYLIPVVLIFGVARVPAVIATVIYALPPAVRMTEMGIRGVPQDVIEAADAFGATARQKLFKVQLPLATPSILLGINQTIMMALGIVVIAALIGAPGLGLEVYQSLSRQQVGRGLEAGLAIVLVAVIFDRISYGMMLESEAKAAKRRKSPDPVPRALRNYVYWSSVILAILVVLVIDAYAVDLSTFPAALQLSIAGAVDGLVRWMRDHLYQIGNTPIGTGPFSDFVTIYLLNPLRALLQTWLPWPVVMAGIGLICYFAAGWGMALFGVGSLFLIGLMGLWPQAMDTLSQVLVATVFALVMGIPLGIWAARSDRVQTVMRPILDLLQTIPAFVYLVPVIMLFNVGRVPGIIASVLYAIPPVIRLTNLGIRRVAPVTVEAATAFGATDRQKLVKVQLPLARPAIMMGINQTIMMVLAMVVVAGLVGGGALGLEVVTGLAKSDVGRGMVAGIAIVILAIILDRITQAWAKAGTTG